jgi:uncharacterized protein
MRIIMAGGSGMRGRALATDFHKDGHDVIILSRNPESHRQVFPTEVQLIYWDGRNRNGWSKSLDGSDVVINLAGENIGASRWSQTRKKMILESRLFPGNALSHAIQASSKRPKLFIQSSAIGYYGPRGDGKLSEDTPLGTDFQSRVCYEWEKSTQAIEDMGVRRVIIRDAVVLDKKNGALPRMVMPFRFFVGGPLSNGNQWFSWIHHQDDVRAIRFLIENQSTRGVYNLSAPNSIRNKDFARTIGRVLRRPALIPVPGIMLQLIFGEMATVLLDGQRVIPSRLLSEGFEFNFPDAETALKDIFSSSG